MPNIKITFPVKNQGNIKATNVVGTVTVPSDVTFLTATTTKGTYNSVSKMWVVGELLPDESALLHLEFSVDDPDSFPFTFVILFSSDQTPDDNPSNDSKTIVVQREDVYPCPDCPTPSIEIEDTTWTEVVVKLDVVNKCRECDIELSVIPMSEVNVDSVVIDSEKGLAKVTLTDPYEPWSFDIEGMCINCPYWCGDGNDFGPFGPKTVSGGPTCCGLEGSLNKLPKFDELDVSEEGLSDGDLYLARDTEGSYQLFVYEEIIGVEQ